MSPFGFLVFYDSFETSLVTDIFFILCNLYKYDGMMNIIGVFFGILIFHVWFKGNVECQTNVLLLVIVFIIKTFWSWAPKSSIYGAKFEGSNY